MKTYEIYQDGHYVKTVHSDDLDKAFSDAKAYVAEGEWSTPGTVRVSMSLAGSPEYVRDEHVQKIVE